MAEPKAKKAAVKAEVDSLGEAKDGALIGPRGDVKHFDSVPSDLKPAPAPSAKSSVTDAVDSVGNKQSDKTVIGPRGEHADKFSDTHRR